MDTAESIHMNLGLAFVKATKPTPLPLGEQLRIECWSLRRRVLLLLTDCHVMPATFTTVAIDAKSNPSILSETSSLSPRERSQTRSALKFITAQSIQIIEGAVVTHSNALSAFHYLKGIYVPMSHLSVDMEAIRHCRQSL
jgi:hypothetical protein